MSRRSTLTLKVLKPYYHINVLSYPQFYRQAALASFYSYRTILGYLDNLGLKLGRLRLRTFARMTAVSISGIAPILRRRKKNIKKREFLSFFLVCYPSFIRWFTDIFREWGLARRRRSPGMLRCLLYLRVVMSLFSSFYFRILALLGYPDLDVATIPGFRREPASVRTSLSPKRSRRHNKKRRRVRRTLLVRRRCRQFKKLSFRKMRSRLYFFLSQTVLRFRLEYALSRHLIEDIVVFLMALNFMGVSSRHFARVLNLPFVGYHQKFRSARFRTLVRSIFSGFFFLDVDLITKQLSYGLRRSRRRQYSYLYHFLPDFVKFSAYHSTVIRGVRFLLRGKVGGQLRTRVFVFEHFCPVPQYSGPLFLQTFCANINYRFADVQTYTGTFGLHLYVYLFQQFYSYGRALES